MEIDKILLFSFLSVLSKQKNSSGHNELFKQLESEYNWKSFIEALSYAEQNDLLIDNNGYLISELGTKELNRLDKEISLILSDEKAERTKLHNEAKLSKWKVKTFWYIFGFALIGSGLSVYNFINSLSPSKNVKKQELRIEQMELELEKLHTSIADQKSLDSLYSTKVEN